VIGQPTVLAAFKKKAAFHGRGCDEAGERMPRKRVRDQAPDEKYQKVMELLREAKQVTETVQDPIMEQLKQCPDAFKVGEILGKAFDSFKYGQDEVLADQLLPPAGTVVPPLA
jgi:hypothetical protein